MSSISWHVFGGVSSKEGWKLYPHDLINNETEVFRENSPHDITTIDGLKGIVGNDLEARVTIHDKVAGQENIQIDETITLALNNRIKAMQVWESVRVRTKTVSFVSALIGVTILVSGGWRSISNRSWLEAVKTLVPVGIIGVIAFQGYKFQSKAAHYQSVLENFPLSIAHFRKNVIEEGLSSLQKNMNLLEGKFKNFGVQLFTDKELMLLLGAWVRQKKEEYPTDEGFGEFIETDSLFKAELEVLPNDNPIRQAVEGCKSFVDSLGEDFIGEQIIKNSKKKYQEFLDTFNQLNDESGEGVWGPLISRYREAVQRGWTMTKETHYQILGQLFNDRLEKMDTAPGEVIEWTTVDQSSNISPAGQMYINTVVYVYWKTVFAEVLSLTDKEQQGKYIKWVRSAFEGLPEGTQNRSFLILCLPT